MVCSCVPVREPRFQRSLNRLRLLHAFAVHEPVIRIPAPGRLGIGPRHPDVERIMQEKIGQQRTNDAPLRSFPRALHKGPIRKLHGSRQPPLNIEPYPFAIRMLIQCLQQQPMLDVVEQCLDIELQNPVILPAAPARDFHSIQRGFLRPVADRSPEERLGSRIGSSTFLTTI